MDRSRVYFLLGSLGFAYLAWTEQGPPAAIGCIVVGVLLGLGLNLRAKRRTR
jgi:hypothetical protein